MLNAFFFLISFACSAMLAPALIRIAQKARFVSRTDLRRLEKVPVPLLGGVCLVFAFGFVSVLAGADFGMRLILCAIPLIVVGLIDDHSELGSKPKFFGQLVTVVIWLSIQAPGTLLLERIGVPWSVAVTLTGFWMMGIVNAANMIDGMDGEAASFAIIAALSLILCSNSTEVSLALGIFTAACAGFLIHNKPPAKIYLGDTGSSFIGFVLSGAAAVLPMAQVDPALVLVPLFIFAFPEVDAILAIYRRVRLRASVFAGDRDHLHHKLQRLGLDVPRTLGVLVVINSICGLSAYLVSLVTAPIIIFSIFFLSVSALIVILSAVFYVESLLSSRMAAFSQTWMRHLQVPKGRAVPIDRAVMACFKFDYYFPELQHRGLERVESFFAEFEQMAKEISPTAAVLCLDPVTCVCIWEAEPHRHLEERAKAISHYNGLLDKHRLYRTDKIIPNGFTFLSGETDRAMLAKLAGGLVAAEHTSTLARVG